MFLLSLIALGGRDILGELVFVFNLVKALSVSSLIRKCNTHLSYIHSYDLDLSLVLKRKRLFVCLLTFMLLWD